MDPERHGELLTAYLDRELSPDERAAVDRLLEQSADARQRLHDLEATSNFLRRMPRRQLEDDFADSVIERLRRESLLRPEPVVLQRRSPRWGGWVGGSLAAAASLVLAVWIGQGLLRPEGLRNVQLAQAPGDAAKPIPAPGAEAAKASARESNETTQTLARANRPRPGDAIRIVSENGDVEVGLMILQDSAAEEGICGVLIDAANIPQTSAAESAGDTIPTFVGNDDDVRQMAEVVSQSRAQNSAPIVDLAVASTSDRTDESPPSVFMRPSSQADLANSVNQSKDVAAAEQPRDPRMASVAGASASRAPDETPAALGAGVSGATNSADRERFAKSGETPPPEKYSREGQVAVTRDATRDIDTSGSPEQADPAPRSRGRYAQSVRGRVRTFHPESDRRNGAGKLAVKSEIAPSMVAEPQTADSDKSLDDLKKLAENNPNRRMAPRKPVDRIKVLLMPVPYSDAEPARRRN